MLLFQNSFDNSFGGSLGTNIPQDAFGSGAALAIANEMGESEQLQVECRNLHFYMKLIYHTKYNDSVSSLIYEIQYFIWEDRHFVLIENTLFEIAVVRKQFKALKSQQWPWIGCLCPGVDVRNVCMIPSQSSPWNKSGITFKFQTISSCCATCLKAPFSCVPCHFLCIQRVPFSSACISIMCKALSAQIYFSTSLMYIRSLINDYSFNGLCYFLTIQF